MISLPFDLVMQLLAGTAVWAIGVLAWEQRSDLFTPLPYPHEDDDEWCVCEDCLRKRKENK